MRVMFYVQHLLGIGHIRRAALFTAAIKKQGLDVTVVFGGQDVPGIDFGDVNMVHLPSAHVTDHTFKPLLDENNQPIDEAWKTRRRESLLSTFYDYAPDVIVCEMFPFGRRQFRFELLPMLEAAHTARPKPLIVSSVRDILVNKTKAERNIEMVTLAREHFDMVLVHGDEKLIALTDSFPLADSIADLIRYTGYIAAPGGQAISTTAGSGEVIVSAGSGATGAPLFDVVLAARKQCGLANKTWRFIAGPNLPDQDFQKLEKHASDNLIVERFRSDFADMLGNCALSISRGGYNTVMDLLRAKARAIVVPYDDGEESEQMQRAHLLQQRNVLRVVETSSLSAEFLARAIDETADATFSGIGAIDLTGADTAAIILARGRNG